MDSRQPQQQRSCSAPRTGLDESVLHAARSSSSPALRKPAESLPNPSSSSLPPPQGPALRRRSTPLKCNDQDLIQFWNQTFSPDPQNPVNSVLVTSFANSLASWGTFRDYPPSLAFSIAKYFVDARGPSRENHNPRVSAQALLEVAAQFGPFGNWAHHLATNFITQNCLLQPWYFGKTISSRGILENWPVSRLDHHPQGSSSAGLANLRAGNLCNEGLLLVRLPTDAERHHGWTRPKDVSFDIPPHRDTDEDIASRDLPMPPRAVTRMVLFDMDLTILSIHTRGCWAQDIQTLVPHVNRCFLYGAIKLIDKGFRVGIVTFSDAAMAGPGQQKLAGGSLVRALLKAAFQQHLRQKNPGWDEAQLKEESNRICGEFLVCALHPTIQNKLLGGQANLPLSKEYHISVVLEEAKRKFGETITDRQTMLFDDDPGNINAERRRKGSFAFLVDNQTGLRSWLWRRAMQEMWCIASGSRLDRVSWVWLELMYQPPPEATRLPEPSSPKHPASRRRGSTRNAKAFPLRVVQVLQSRADSPSSHPLPDEAQPGLEREDSEEPGAGGEGMPHKFLKLEAERRAVQHPSELALLKRSPGDDPNLRPEGQEGGPSEYPLPGGEGCPTNPAAFESSQSGEACPAAISGTPPSKPAAPKLPSYIPEGLEGCRPKIVPGQSELKHAAANLRTSPLPPRLRPDSLSSSWDEDFHADSCPGCGLGMLQHKEVPRFRLRQIPLEFQASRGWFLVRLSEPDCYVDPLLPYGRTFPSIPALLKSLHNIESGQQIDERKLDSSESQQPPSQERLDLTRPPASHGRSCFYPVWNRQWVSQGYRWSRDAASSIPASFAENQNLFLNPDRYEDFVL